MIRQALPSDLESVTIVDAGCGFADFGLFLQERGESPAEYTGVESLKEFADIAKKRSASKILHLDVLSDALPHADYYVCSGALNTLSTFETFLFLKKCFDVAEKGVVFNFLYGNRPSDIYNYIDDATMEEMVESFHAEIFFEVRDYIPDDKTVGIRKCVQSSE